MLLLVYIAIIVPSFMPIALVINQVPIAKPIILLGKSLAIRANPNALIRSSAEEKQTVIANTSHQILILEVREFKKQARKSTP